MCKNTVSEQKVAPPTATLRPERSRMRVFRFSELVLTFLQTRMKASCHPCHRWEPTQCAYRDQKHTTIRPGCILTTECQTLAQSAQQSSTSFGHRLWSMRATNQAARTGVLGNSPAGRQAPQIVGQSFLAQGTSRRAILSAAEMHQHLRKGAWGRHTMQVASHVQRPWDRKIRCVCWGIVPVARLIRTSPSHTTQEGLQSLHNYGVVMYLCVVKKP